jgi:quercetin dioxygenase-like cupin family protein
MNEKSISVQNPSRGKNKRVFLDGSERYVADLPSMFIGKGVYQPGWRWSKHAGPQTEKESTRHIGYIISGSMVAQDASGQETTLKPGDAFEIGPNHDGWVIGDEPCVALDFEPR